ncbi:MAG: undecaprenyl-phosphate galactose phosphotransferase [candidate division WS6 bacterium GW2011_GWF2_39_15]|uniref:Undecaprenyl-phosphate galactose phosphotransferase n=1 Tax=candidate division WS6 bacterium GW2011_GWF2_39_15 TaxID=1619100 RepID=A0A0G0MNX5_9BACT|nr:MAG: undecaprenyl-phosphate galactose phosphotransferase [candidate division WS6 bacterium GW2011_GWF2_39_15]
MYRLLKRILDIIIAVPSLLVASPLLILIALAIKLDGTNGPVFNESSTRLGRGKKPFFMYKFRSMEKGSHIEFWKRHPELKALKQELEQKGKLPSSRDPRVTKVGRFIRKTDLDELPQLFNVIRGEMSIVGPRAPFKEEVERYLELYPDIREGIDDAYSVKPGITGIWQVSGRNSISTPDRYKMEAGYARRKNILDDIKIILKTPFVVLTRKGSTD